MSDDGGYSEWCRGLRMLESRGYDALRPCRTRADWEAARATLLSLHSSVIGAGSNTWHKAKERYRAAERVFRELPTPCEATLHHVAERCDNVGYGGICEKCSETVQSVMQNTCALYGIALD